MFETILPSQAKPLEINLERATAFEGLPVDGLRHLTDPYRVDARFLPWLAFAAAVDIWDESWPEEKRRSVIAQQFRLHRLKGTLGGARAFLDLVGVSIDEAFTPPMKIYSGPSLTREEREAWLRNLPQVRVWRRNERGNAGHSVVMGGGLHGAIMRTRFFVPSTAGERMRRRARWVVKGAETDVRVTEFGSYFQVHLPGTMGRRVYSRALANGSRFFQPSVAGRRLMTIAPVTTSARRGVVGPRLTPVSSEPEIIAEKGKAGRAVFAGCAFGRSFFLPSTSEFRLYARHAVSAGGEAAVRTRSKSFQFMGVGRYGMAPHSAELKLRIRGRRKPFAAAFGTFAPRTRFWLPRNPEPVGKALAALRASKRHSDRIAIDTQTSFQFIAGRPAFAGDRIVI